MGVDTWEPDTSSNGAWKPDESGGASVNGGGFEMDTENDHFSGDFATENISKHDDGFGAADGGCRNCGAEGHFARDCPDKPPNSGECYNCGEQGHNKSDCPNPRVEREFTGTCYACGKEGHRSSDCPDKPPSACKICKGEGHEATECSANRVLINFAHLGIDDLSSEDAWAALLAADKEKDVEDIRKAILAYAKAYPELTFELLESSFRESEMNTYLIAKKQEVSDTHTITNLQGQIDQTYVISIQFTSKPRRAKQLDNWPADAEENLSRLPEAGFVLDRMVQKCSNCNELGHGSKKCPEERVEKEKIVVNCALCNEEGHYARDCPQPRKAPRDKTCRNCGEEGHKASECEKERVVTCRNCDEEGHKASDCPHPKNMAKVQCRNCDEFGHTSRDCPAPKDWSRVECTNCHEKGHGAKRCPQPPAEENDAAGDDGGWGDAGNAGGASGGWE